MFTLLNGSKTPWLDFSDKNEKPVAAPRPFSRVMRFYFKVRWISCLAPYEQLACQSLALALNWNTENCFFFKKKMSQGALSSRLRERLSLQVNVTYLMFQVDGEVRLKWLLFHFACKTWITENTFSFELCKNVQMWPLEKRKRCYHMNTSWFFYTNK